MPTATAWQEPGRVEMRPWALQTGLHMQVSAPQGRGARSQLAAGTHQCPEGPGSCRAGGDVAVCVGVSEMPAVLVGFHTSIKLIFIVYCLDVSLC